jgi:regulatory protein
VITGTVTAIAASGRREGRFEVAVDGARAAVVSLELIERLALRVGLVLDERVGEALARGAGELATYDRALGLLAVQGRSALDLRRRLVQGGEPAAHADAAVARLIAAGLLDDAAYARQLARSRVLGRGESRRRVSQVLGQKGVARELAAEAVAEVFDDEAVDEAEMVEVAARKRLRSLAGLDDATRRRRLWGYLARRGFDGSAIRRAVDRVLGGIGSEEGGDDGACGVDGELGAGATGTAAGTDDDETAPGYGA